MLISDVLMHTEDRSELAASLAQFDLDPFGLHGPGAVFDCAKGREKWDFDFMPGIPCRIYRSQHGFLTQSGHDGNPSSRVSVVPKDFRSHRIICVEPKEFMFYQQGLRRALEHTISVHFLASKAIDFKNQLRSFRLSRRSDYATIDLSDASDNLSLSLARLLIPKKALKLATCARSQHIVLPDGDVVDHITTLFTMGNALCFPFQTLIFWGLALATMFCKEHRVGTYSRQTMLDVCTKYRLRVFGDDIIVPNRYFDDVCLTLSQCGLIVNAAKSCCLTPVRESCGSWFYGNVDARIVRLKTHTVSSDKDWVSSLQSATLLIQSGMARTSEEILRSLDNIYPVPYGTDGLPGYLPWSRGIVRWRNNLDGDLTVPNYQRIEVRRPTIKDSGPDVLTGEVGLYNYFVGRGSHMGSHHSVLHTEWEWVPII